MLPILLLMGAFLIRDARHAPAELKEPPMTSVSASRGRAVNDPPTTLINFSPPGDTSATRVFCGAGVPPAQCGRDGRTTRRSRGGDSRLSPGASVAACLSPLASRELPPSTFLARVDSPTGRFVCPTILKTARSAARDSFPQSFLNSCFFDCRWEVGR